MEFVDLKRQLEVIKTPLRQRIERVLTDCRFVLGPEVAELEERLADFTGVKYCVSVANGTDAIQICLRALGIGPGDAVYVPSFTFVATAEVVNQVGATPIFVDVLADSFNMDPNSLRRAIAQTDSATSLKSKAAIAVDLFGLPADYPALRSITEEHGLVLIEDAAQALGARVENKMACSFGLLATTSFFPAKPLGCYGDGGAIFTDDDGLVDVLRSLRVHGQGSHQYDNERVGLNSRLDTLQAAILLAKLDFFKSELSRRDEIADYYSQTIGSDIDTPIVPDGVRSAWAQYTITVGAAERDEMRNHLAVCGIPTAVYYPKPLHRQPVYEKSIHSFTECPVSTLLCERVLSIPIHPYLTDKECQNIASSILDYTR